MWETCWRRRKMSSLSNRWIRNEVEKRRCNKTQLSKEIVSLIRDLTVGDSERSTFQPIDEDWSILVAALGPRRTDQRHPTLKDVGMKEKDEPDTVRVVSVWWSGRLSLARSVVGIVEISLAPVDSSRMVATAMCSSRVDLHWAANRSLLSTNRIQI